MLTAYRPPSSRERFRIHSSLLSGLPSRSSLPTSSLVTTTTTTSAPQNTVFTTTVATSNAISSTSSQSPRIRRYGFSLVSGRPVRLSFTRENSTSIFPTQISIQSTTHSGAVTNPTYTSSDRGIFSTRETPSSESDRSRIPVIRPNSYRIVFDDINQFRTSVHTVIRPENETPQRNCPPDQRPNPPPTTTNSTNSTSSFEPSERLRSHLRDVISGWRFARNSESQSSEDIDRELDRELDREMERPATFVSPVRRLNSESESNSTTPTNMQGASPQQVTSQSGRQAQMHPRPVPRFQFRPRMERGDSDFSPVRRLTSDPEIGLMTPTSGQGPSQPGSPVQLHSRPMPRIQIRPRLLQEPSQVRKIILKRDFDNT